jgi:hypothetical protein
MTHRSNRAFLFVLKNESGNFLKKTWPLGGDKGLSTATRLRKQRLDLLTGRCPSCQNTILFKVDSNPLYPKYSHFNRIGTMRYLAKGLVNFDSLTPKQYQSILLHCIFCK